MSEFELSVKRMDEIFKNTCGKQVRITYVPYKYIEEISNPINTKTIFGVIENMCERCIYIINPNGCFEILRLKQILEMVEIID